MRALFCWTVLLIGVWGAGEVVTNEDLIGWTEEGLLPETIRSRIIEGDARFDLSFRGLEQLCQAGVSPGLLSWIVESYRPPLKGLATVDQAKKWREELDRLREQFRLQKPVLTKNLVTAMTLYLELREAQLLELEGRVGSGN